MGDKVIRSINGRSTIDWKVKNSMGNGEVTVLDCMTQGYELRRGNAGWRGYRAEGNKGGKMGQL